MKSKSIRPVVILAVLTAAALVYFNAAPKAEMQTPQAAVHGYDYRCGDLAISLRLMEDESAELQLGEQVLNVAQSPAASGVLYTSAARGQGEVSFHTKGDEAVLTRDGATTACHLTKADADSAVVEDQTADQAAVEATGVTLTDIEWTLESLDGKPLPEGTSASIRFDGGRAAGNGGCNRFGGDYTAEGQSLKFGALMSTQMACTTERMELELRLHDLLRKVDGYVIEDSGALALKSGEVTVMVFRAVKAGATEK